MPLRRSGPDRPTAGWRATIPFGFVVMSLIALAAVPVLMNRWIATDQDVIETVTQPARALVFTAKSNIALEVSLTRGFLLTRDPTFLDRYREVRESHRELYSDLRPLVRQLGPGAIEPLDATRRLIAERDAEMDAFLRGELSAAEFTERLPSRQLVFENAIAALDRLEEAVMRAEDAHRDRIATLRSRGFWITTWLIFLALVGSLVILLVGRRELRLIAELQENRLRLAELAETRSRLIRGIGHDLKNPLGAAEGYAHLLEDGLQGELTPEQKRYIIRIRRMHRSILDIINNLLEFARAESGELAVSLSETDIDEIVRETAEDYRASAERAGLEFTVRASGDLPRTRTDPERVRAILGNLLSNAIKYTPAGGRIEARSGIRSGGAAPGRGLWITLDVADTGPGIPADKSEYIFQEYSRLEPEAAEGAGIGLAISRTTARLLGGDLTFRSTVGQGSTFTLWLPAQHATGEDS